MGIIYMTVCLFALIAAMQVIVIGTVAITMTICGWLPGAIIRHRISKDMRNGLPRMRLVK